eukprot:1902982-Prymnesium_polylepis.1
MRTRARPKPALACSTYTLGPWAPHSAVSRPRVCVRYSHAYIHCEGRCLRAMRRHRPPDGGDCRPRLYVYELPATYLRTHHTHVARRNLSFTDAARALLPGFPSGVGLFQTPMYSLSLTLHERALGYRCRTRDPVNADLFFVPASNTEMTARPSRACAERAAEAAARGGRERALYSRLREAAGDALSARGGADHLLINPRVGAEGFETHPLCEVRCRQREALPRPSAPRATVRPATLAPSPTARCVQLNLLDPRLGSATRFAVTEKVSYERPYTAHAVFHSTPWPSWVRLTPESAGLPWAAPRPRTHLVAGAWGPGGGASGFVHDLRVRLRELCEGAAAA